MTKIMLIDDDESMQHLIERIVSRSNFDFCCAGCGVAGLELLKAEQPDLLILDVMLPDVNGFEICRSIREEGFELPIIFLTAKGDIVDKSIGFKAGADDYLVKPFLAEELSLRIEALLRRKRQEETEGDGTLKGVDKGEVFQVGDFELHFGKYEVRLKGQQVQLTTREIELLELLVSDPGSVFTREQILSHMWGDKDTADPNSITVFVRKIREKIEPDPSKPQYLITVWRVGYKFVARL